MAGFLPTGYDLNGKEAQNARHHRQVIHGRESGHGKEPLSIYMYDPIHVHRRRRRKS